ncbi:MULTISPECIES: pilus assembly protein TadG-related protein [unclassified Nocardioides]|uniref:pilus assembly protein TadG-related protein n=1 Tax=unclassified Nocardioides TaxID=2615069 RepID=UPI0030152E7F
MLAARRRDEEGAVLPFVAVIVVVLLLSAAMAVDLGLQRVARGDMQAVADAVALDLARELDGRDAATLGPLMPALATASRDRNPDAVGDDPALDVDLGELDDRGDFVPVTGVGVPTAVRVTARTAVDFAFAGVTGIDRGPAVRSAVGVAELGACFRVGSFIARLDSTTSPLLDVLLGTMLGTDLTLSAVDYHGLAASEVTLLDLVEVGGLQVGSVDELLQLDQLSVGRLYLAVAKVLTAQGDLAAATLLRSINVHSTTPTIAVADLISATASDRAALDLGINVLDLVTGAAYAAGAAAGHSLVVDDLGVPGLLGASLVVTEAPQIGCGGPGTTASTAQVRLDVPVTIPGSTLAVDGIGSVTLAPTTLSVSIDLGQAVAELLDVTCGPQGAQRLDLRLASAVVGGLAVTGSTGVKTQVKLKLVDDLLTVLLQVLGLNGLLAGLPTIDVDVALGIGAGTQSNGHSTLLQLPLPASYTSPVGSASGVVLGNPVVQPVVGAKIRVNVPQLIGPPKVTVLDAGPLFTGVMDPILQRVLTTVVQPLLATLQTAVVAPLAHLLGLQLAGADVWALREPVCGGPRLRQ